MKNCGAFLFADVRFVILRDLVRDRTDRVALQLQAIESLLREIVRVGRTGGAETAHETKANSYRLSAIGQAVAGKSSDSLTDG